MDSMRMRMTRKDSAAIAVGVAFLLPNILGFLAFTLIPLIFSLVLAFSNWDLKLHNMFHPEAHIHFVGLDNFRLLLSQPEFWTYLGNTLYMMLGMPVGIAASLMAAIMLSKDLRGGSTKAYVWMIAGAVLIASTALLSAIGLGAAGMTILVTAMIGGMLILGTVGGTSVYRTLFYVPNFTAGVAVYLLWKKLYNSQNGPINNALAPPLHGLGSIINAMPPWIVGGLGVWALAGLGLLLALVAIRRLYWLSCDGDLARPAMLIPTIFLALPIGVCAAWKMGWPAPIGLAIAAGLSVVVWGLIGAIAATPAQYRVSRWEGHGDALIFCATLCAAEFALFGLAATFHQLPAMAQDGLEPPHWLESVYWAKPALMLMGFWGAVGSGTMLLYLAALTNVPGELYEAADIDGASRFAKFWNVTWPQLAPTTFFIVVMGVIGGLQSGFDTAKVMTNGGPAGATTTLSYFIYTEGFTTGRLAFSSAVAWTLFLLVLLMTLFNWTFGNKYVND
jgi:multiple sugar transport system permease protein